MARQVDRTKRTIRNLRILAGGAAFGMIMHESHIPRAARARTDYARIPAEVVGTCVALGSGARLMVYATQDLRSDATGAPRS